MMPISDFKGVSKLIKKLLVYGYANCDILILLQHLDITIPESVSRCTAQALLSHSRDRSDFDATINAIGIVRSLIICDELDVRSSIHYIFSRNIILNQISDVCIINCPNAFATQRYPNVIQ